ncbi:MAG: InlB B-repeat-containing protein [Bacteroidales bacterium]|nr:InlB B-repeat-containing protein [Bacteroidales bacterium]MCM1414759.1 InlB B-repeat-containing protein [bacterium]MCM1423235.1 InlB B-repeat-containing protein [bacterium]
MKRTGKKLTAWILAVLIAVTSAELPVIPAYAQEQEQALPELPAEKTPDEDAENGVSGNSTVSGNSDDEQITPFLNPLSDDAADEEMASISLELEGVYQFGGAPTGSAPTSYTSRPKKAPRSGDSIETYLYNQLRENRDNIDSNSQATIDISSYNLSLSTDLDYLGRVYSGVLNEHPDLYDVDHSWAPYYNTTTNQIVSMQVTYIQGLDHDKWEQGFEAAKAAVTNPSNQLQTAIELHDYLAVNCVYDYQNFLDNTVPQVSHSTYGVFANRVAVCDGYSLAYKYLLSQFGIDCYMVTSTPMEHAWNLIELNGKYYQVDVTWDDPTWDLVGRVSHQFMFLSDTTFESIRVGNPSNPDYHHDWQVTKGSDIVSYIADDTAYDSAFWANSTAPLVFYEGACYYTDCDASQYKTVIRKKEDALADISTSGDTFHTIINSGYNIALSGLFQIGGYLYYNNYNHICRTAIDNVKEEIIFTPDESGYIYGCAYYPEPPTDPNNPSKIHYSLHDSTNLEEAETVLVAEIPDLPQPDDPVPARLTRPTKTTYPVGTELDLTGGKVNYPKTEGGRETVELTADMIDGFDSTAPGIQTLTVTYDQTKPDETLSFDVLIVEVPELTDSVILCGQALNTISLSDHDNDGTGTYAWKDGTTPLTTEGEQTVSVVFTPNDLSLFQTIELMITVTVEKITLAEPDTVVTLENDSYVYNGNPRKPSVTVSHQGKALRESVDYTLSYKDNSSAGTATVTVSGKGAYSGSIEKTFTITPAPLTITAADKTIRVGDPLPAADSYGYTTTGLCGADILTTLPVLTCAITDTAAAGEYEIVPSGADAGANYTITYVNGKLTVTAGDIVVYTVRFDVQGHGTAPAPVTDLTAGSKVAKPTDPTAAGWRFDGWFKEAACTNAWNFDTDTVQADLTLYAKWTQEDGGDGDPEEDGFTLSEIPDLIYTGKAQKPAITVSYGRTLLKSGRDYTLKYYHNTNVNADGILADSSSFDASLPYVEITGKGNYAAKIRLNFNILPRSIGDGSAAPADGVTLKVTDQFATANKTLKPFSSIRSVTSMRLNKDFSLRLTAVNTRDRSGAALAAGTELTGASIPAGYSGEFLLAVTGLGNYTGSITKSVYVTDKAHLLKNMTVKLGQNLKNIPFREQPIELTPSEVETPDTFTVKYGRTALRYGTDYTVSYRNNDRVGKAELIVTGIGEYAGTKSVFFNIKGKAFNAKKVRVDGIENKVYTGLAQTQDGMTLLYGAGTADEQSLAADTHYTVSYKKNTDKGTATMTFTGLPQAGFSGSFKKTFKITPASITETTQADAMKDLSFCYNKNGVKPVDEIVLTNAQGILLQNTKDYTLKYQNNKAVAEKTAQKPPTVIIKGKGNYTGELKVFFTIRKADFDSAEDGLTFTATSIPYLPDQPADYTYTPVINVRDQNTKLRLNKDYTITYLDNTQADYESFVRTLKETPKDVHPIPRAVITPTADSPYQSSHTVLLPVYMSELTKDNLEVKIVGSTAYTGGQVRPKVEVYYTGDGGRVLLEEGNHKDYVVVYGANNTTGKNKGKLTIHGTVPDYGGYVTVKFDIQKKSFSN